MLYVLAVGVNNKHHDVNHLVILVLLPIFKLIYSCLVLKGFKLSLKK